MEEESAAAAATVLAFAGESSLRTGAAELARRGGEVARAADALGIRCEELVAAAAALSRADEETRLQAVFALEKAATALEISAEGRQRALRRATKNLGLACQDQEQPFDNEHLLRLAREVWVVADGLNVRLDALELAGRALQCIGKDDPMRPQAVAVLDSAAATLERAAGARVAVLGCGAASLAVACQEYIWASDNMPALRRAAARARQGGGRLSAMPSGAKQEDKRRGGGTTGEQRGGRPTAGPWWLLGRRQATAPQDLEATLLLAAAGEPNLDDTQGLDLRLATQGFAIFGSLTMLPYLGPEGVLKLASDPYRKWVHVVFCICWTLVAVGVRCSFTKSKIKLMCAQMSSDMGMLGVNALVIMFSSWLLAPADTISFWLLMGMAVLLHLGSFIW